MPIQFVFSIIARIIVVISIERMIMRILRMCVCVCVCAYSASFLGLWAERFLG